MGGKEGSRGYIYQSFASIFEALCQNDWDKIYVEYNSPNDKVDIALENSGHIFKSIQVKSTINSFDKSSIIKWTCDLFNDNINATEFEMFLIGNASPSAISFKNAIDSLKETNNDKSKLSKIDNESLSNFDTSLLSGKTLLITFINYDLDSLMKLLVAALLKYISKKNIVLDYDRLELIAKTIVTNNYLSSLGNSGINKKDFDFQIEKYVMMLNNKCFGTKVLGIISFTRGTDDISQYADPILSFTGWFEGRKLKSEYTWDTVYNTLNRFLLQNTNSNYIYQLMIDSHLSIAFACGRILDPKSRINALPSNPKPNHKTEIWKIDDFIDDSCFDLVVKKENIDENEYDTALIISITHDIKANVEEYISESQLKIGKEITLTIGGKGPCPDSIVNGKHAYCLANQVIQSLSQRSILERKANLHIFASAPNGFMFFLGQQSRGFGNFTLYEYDFEGKDSGTYSPSFKNLP